MKERKMFGRISYVENWHGKGEHFVFEWRVEGEEEWNFDCAAPLCEPKDGEMKPGRGYWIHFEVLTKIREWGKLGITDICWR